MPGSRATVNDGPDGLEIVMPAPRVWPAIVLIGLWLAGWVTGEAFALRQILAPGPIQAKAFLLAWLAFWTLGGAIALSTCLWMLFGHERVRLRPDAFTLQREAFGFGPRKVYQLDRVRDLRARAMPALDVFRVADRAPAPDGTKTLSPGQADAVLGVLGVCGPGIGFTYDGRPVRFGVALDPTEAQSIVSQLRGRHTFDAGRSAA